MSRIEFDADSHTYRADGRTIPSVTQILTDVGLIDAQWFTEQATIRGTYVHEATALDDHDSLDFDRLDDALAGYVSAWRKFRAETGAEILSIEEMVAPPSRTYAGTLDRRILFNRSEWVVDIKSGGPLRWHALQTAGYAGAVRAGPRPHSQPGVLKRATVHLHANGRYVFRPHDDPFDFDMFGAAVALYHWKRGK